MSHDRGCPCGKKAYEYGDCEEASCNRRPKLETVGTILSRSPAQTVEQQLLESVFTEHGYNSTTSGRSSASAPAQSNAPKKMKYDSAWADAAERAEWAFVATALREAEKLMSHRISWISVATGIAEDRARSGWRDYDPN